MVDISRVPSIHRGTQRRLAAVVTSASVLAFICLAPGIASASDASDPATWEARPYSPLPWAALGAPGGAVSLSFAGDGGGLTDAAGRGTGFTAVQPATTGSPYFVPDAVSVVDGALLITAGIAGAASQQNVLGVGIAADSRITRVTVAVNGPTGSGGRAGIWFGATEGDRLELVLEAPSEGAGAAVTLTERRGGAVAQSSTVTVPPGQVTLDLVVDASAASAAGRVTSAAGEMALGTLSGVSTSLVDGSLLDTATRPADSAVTAMTGVLASGAPQTDDTPALFAIDDFTVADLTPAPAPVEVPAATATPTPSPSLAPPAPSPAPSQTPNSVPNSMAAPTRPQPPLDLRIAPSGAVNDLAWSASASDDIVGYNVESAASADGPWEPLTIDPSPALAFRDLSPAIPGTTFYRVTAMDARGAVSVPARPVSFTREAPTPVASPVVPAEGAPLLVPENAPDDELESVLFFGDAEPSVEGGSLVFGTAEMAATGGSSGGIGGRNSDAEGGGALANGESVDGTTPPFGGSSDSNSNSEIAATREEDPVNVARSGEIDVVSSSVNGIGILAIAVLATLSLFIHLRGGRRGQRLR